MERIQAFVTQLCQSLLSILKIVLQSRRVKRVKPSDKAMARGIVVLGNGPSLNNTVDSAADFLAMHDLLAVNFAACTPLFKQLRPAYYLLADGHFFRALDQPNVKQLWSSIAHVEWQMTGWLADVPAQDAPEGCVWTGAGGLEGRYALPGAFKAYRPFLFG